MHVTNILVICYILHGNHTKCTSCLLQVKFVPEADFKNYFTDYSTLKHYIASGIRLRILAPASVVPLRSYVAIADLEIDGMCPCFGHAAICTGVVSLCEQYAQ